MSLPPVPKNTHWAKGLPAGGGLHQWLEQVRERIERVASDLPGFVTEAMLEEALGSFTGGGIQNVSGTVDLPNEPGLYEVYATATATVEGIGLVAGDAAVFRYLSNSWSYMVVGVDTTWQPAPGTSLPADSDPPTSAVLAVSGSGSVGSTRTLTVSGAIDTGSGLHAAPYAFSTDGGTTWSPWQAGSTFTTPALSVGTYQPRARVRDAAPIPNVAVVSAADFTITGPTLPITDTFTEPDGTLVGGRTIGGFTYSDSAYDTGGFSGQPGGIAEIIGGKAVSSSTNERTAFFPSVGTKNVRITATIDHSGANGARTTIGLGTSIKSASGGDGVFITYVTGEGLRLRKTDGGTILGSYTAAGTGAQSGLTYSLEYDGTTASLVVNGTVVASGAVAIAGTRIGFSMSNHAGQSIDNFTVEAL